MAKRRRASEEEAESFSEASSPDPESSLEVPETAEAKPEPKPETKKQEPAKKALPEKPKPPEQRVPLRVFATLAGKKWDQYAGFVYYAKKQKLGPRSIEEWRAAMAEFQKRAT